LVDDLYLYTDWTLFIGLAVLWAWAFADCLARKAKAFPAVGKLTKPAWVAILGVLGVLGYFWATPEYAWGTIGLIPIVTAAAAAIYLADVRPAIRDITGGR
jgi:hypothetical protein